jgi:hypothetical protein
MFFFDRDEEANTSCGAGSVLCRRAGLGTTQEYARRLNSPGPGSLPSARAGDDAPPWNLHVTFFPVASLSGWSRTSASQSRSSTAASGCALVARPPPAAGVAVAV